MTRAVLFLCCVAATACRSAPAAPRAPSPPTPALTTVDTGLRYAPGPGVRRPESRADTLAWRSLARLDTALAAGDEARVEAARRLAVGADALGRTTWTRLAGHYTGVEWAAVRVRRARASGRCADARAAQAVADSAHVLMDNCESTCSPRAVRALDQLRAAVLAADSLAASSCASGGLPGAP